MVGHQTARECISSNYRILGTWKYEFESHTDSKKQKEVLI
jgi:hypothetical protein